MHALAERVRQPRHLRMFSKKPTGQGGPCQLSGTTASTFLALSERGSQHEEDRGCLASRIMEDLEWMQSGSIRSPKPSSPRRIDGEHWADCWVGPLPRSVCPAPTRPTPQSLASARRSAG